MLALDLTLKTFDYLRPHVDPEQVGAFSFVVTAKEASKSLFLSLGYQVKLRMSRLRIRDALSASSLHSSLDPWLGRAVVRCSGATSSSRMSTKLVQTRRAWMKHFFCLHNQAP